jgi:hypothetical protein
VLDVQADAGWTVNVMQPKATYSSPPATQQWKGRGWQATGLFSLKAGSATFHAVTPNGKEEFRVALLDENGVYVEGIAETTGVADVSATIPIPKDGVYLLLVISDGDWTVDVQQ